MDVRVYGVMCINRYNFMLFRHLSLRACSGVAGLVFVVSGWRSAIAVLLKVGGGGIIDTFQTGLMCSFTCMLCVEKLA